MSSKYFWTYDDINYTQKLKGFVALCDLCHDVKHFGRTGNLAAQGILDIDRVINHFLRVNDCNIRAFEEHKKSAFKQWKERSQHNWEIDFGEYQFYIEQEKIRKSLRNNPDYLTTLQFGKKVGICNDHVSRLIRKGRIKAQRVGDTKFWVIHKNELEQYLKNKKHYSPK